MHIYICCIETYIRSFKSPFKWVDILRPIYCNHINSSALYFKLQVLFDMKAIKSETFIWHNLVCHVCEGVSPVREINLHTPCEARCQSNWWLSSQVVSVFQECNGCLCHSHSIYWDSSKYPNIDCIITISSSSSSNSSRPAPRSYRICIVFSYLLCVNYQVLF